MSCCHTSFATEKKESKEGGGGETKVMQFCDQNTYACNWVKIEVGKNLYKHHIICQSQEF
jgi:hypothetical protein